MIPIVETTASESDSEKVDRRKTRKISWKEARLTSARHPEQEQPIFYSSFKFKKQQIIQI